MKSAFLAFVGRVAVGGLQVHGPLRLPEFRPRPELPVRVAAHGVARAPGEEQRVDLPRREGRDRLVVRGDDPPGGMSCMNLQKGRIWCLRPGL